MSKVKEALKKRKEKLLRVSEVNVKAPKTIEMCMSCHDGKEDPDLKMPLNDLNWLRQEPRIQDEMLRRIHAVGQDEQMPPSRPLGSMERLEIEKYLERLGER
jgi:hypothetical protein